jgi:hypothetical protein
MVVRFLFVFAVLTFCTGLLKFFGVRYRPLSQVHHFSGLFLITSAVTHMVLNRRPLLNAFRWSKTADK